MLKLHWWQLETNKTINENKKFFSSEVENKDLVINNKETNSMAMKTEILKSTIAANEQLCRQVKKVVMFIWITNK